MKRGKPHQQIYRPGSGPLRRSIHYVEETESDTGASLNSRHNFSKPMQHKQKGETAPQGDYNLDMDAIDTKFEDLSVKDDTRRKPKKPDQTFYIPKPLAQARESTNFNRSDDNLFQTSVDNKPVGNRGELVNGNPTGSTEQLNVINTRSKRYSNRRRPCDNFDTHERSWRTNSPHRDTRHGSEPRALPYQSINVIPNRGMRDTRSVEPSMGPPPHYGGDKYHPKPPTGRRHSTICVEPEKRPKNLESLPPRLRKKYLEDNKMHINYIGTQSEGTWDGNSLVFQGSSQHPATSQYKYPPKQLYHVPNESQLQNMNLHNQHHMPNNYNNVYYTLPRRGRGRARVPQDYDNSSVGGFYRCVTPDRMQRNSPCNSRPSTPPPSFRNKTRSNENLNRGGQTRRDRYDKQYEDAHMDKGGSQKDNEGNKSTTTVGQNNADLKTTPVRGFNESLEAQLSPVSPNDLEESPPKPDSLISVDNQVLDWSEEVELHVRLEAEEALSDTITRSSSMASLVETSTASQPSSTKKKSKRKNKRNKKRSSSRYREDRKLNRQNSHNNTDSNVDNFNVPDSYGRRRRNSKDCNYEENSNRSREPSFDRDSNNWRDDCIRSRHNSEREGELKKGGILILPQKESEKVTTSMANVDWPKFPDMRKSTSPTQLQKSLYDPDNPRKPIIVKSNSARINVPGFSQNTKSSPQLNQYTNDQLPNWYDETLDHWKNCQYAMVLKNIKRADYELQYIYHSGLILVNRARVEELRYCLMDSLIYLLGKDLKFCQTENVEQHFWRILYHNIIEIMRKAIATDPEMKGQYKEYVLCLIDEGTKYFENLLHFLEQTYSFKVNNHVGYNNLVPQKGLGNIRLALISAQKIFLFLGDLGRYKEQINETSNYGKCRQWYIKAHEINPKNGKPYNKLAVLAFYARRKLDAVYYYMRSLMSSNPVTSARENLNALFDENRKKYEQGERKRREERLEKARQHMKEKESESIGPPGSLRREIWIRPGGGRRVHRTTSAVQESKHIDSEEEDLAALSYLDVNKRFVTSYLHVHGKLITKIGMESFQEAALQMLKEFRALLQHSPIPLNCNRFLQLLALNMFAIESTQLKDPQFQNTSGYRSELQERALVISLQMFNLILERSVSIFHDHLRSKPDTLKKLTMDSLPQDFHMLLPAIKTWCDWMMCHTKIWNPPPSTLDYRVGPAGDAWSRLASLMNQLQKLDQSIVAFFIHEPREGFDQVLLPEDVVLSGFTPLMYNEHVPTFAPKDIDPELAQFAVRLEKVNFFGTLFLCGLNPPVLKLEMDSDFSEYVSIVATSSNRDSPLSPSEFIDGDDLLVESFSEDEADAENVNVVDENASSEIQQLLSRKVELEKRQRTQELHRQRVQKILQQAIVSVHIEIRPKVLIPDTNCFIDYLSKIKIIVNSHNYTLMVPLVVLNELEGLGRGGKCPAPSPRAVADPQHVLKVADSAKNALEYLGGRHTNIKCVTTKGTTLPTFTFTVEEDSLNESALRNDDKILATCLMLCKNSKEKVVEETKASEECESKPRKLYREVVLLTEDRNLRVKALARDLPVRELPDFMQWAGLG